MIVGLAGGAPLIPLAAPAPVGPNPAPSLVDPTALEAVLQGGELPLEAVLIGTGAAMVSGVVLTLVAASVRGRSRRRPADLPPDPPATVADPESTRSNVPWPLSDIDAYRVNATESIGTPDGPAESRDHPAMPWPSGWPIVRSKMSGTAQDAAQEVVQEGWPHDDAAPTRRSMGEDARGGATLRPSAGHPFAGPSSAVGWPSTERSEPRVSTQVTEAEPTETGRDAARVGLGTPQAPLVVELHSENSAPARPNMFVIAAGAVVAVGVAFAGGALVGAGVGTTLGATIGLAFAGGAGTAIGVTAFLLRGHR